MARQCPECGTEMKEVRYHNELIDRCHACGGAFFDKGELESIIRIVGIFQSVPLAEKEIDTVEEKEQARELPCPSDQTVMEKREVAGVIVDVCPECQGIWLDKGEIVALKLAEEHIKENLNLYIRLGN